MLNKQDEDVRPDVTPFTDFINEYVTREDYYVDLTDLLWEMEELRNNKQPFVVYEISGYEDLNINTNRGMYLLIKDRKSIFKFVKLKQLLTYYWSGFVPSFVQDILTITFEPIEYCNSVKSGYSNILYRMDKLREENKPHMLFSVLDENGTDCKRHCTLVTTEEQIELFTEMNAMVEYSWGFENIESEQGVAV